MQEQYSDLTSTAYDTHGRCTLAYLLSAAVVFRLAITESLL